MQRPNCLASFSRAVVLAVLFLALLLLANDHALAQDPEESGENVTLRVATKPLEPFVFIDDEPLRGFSIDYWDEVASRVGVETEWILYDTVGEIIEAVELGDADAAIAGISITEDRELVIDFSQAYYNSGFQIVTDSSGSSTFGALFSLIASGTFLVPLLILLVLIFLVSHLVWWFERGHDSDDFPESYRSGIGEAVWWSTVSVITGGEAVKAINGTLARVIAIFWMLIGLFLLAFVTARATSVLTVAELQSDISSLDDLQGKKVATVANTTSENFLIERGINPVLSEDLNEALDRIVTGDVDAVVFDAPVVAYALATTHRGQDLQLVESVRRTDPYGIALPEDGPMNEQ
ncbi:MAG: transporter substrate-binding domain-containing protein, partial [Acidimicrobiales bacterium]